VNIDRKDFENEMKVLRLLQFLLIGTLYLWNTACNKSVKTISSNLTVPLYIDPVENPIASVKSLVSLFDSDEIDDGVQVFSNQSVANEKFGQQVVFDEDRDKTRYRKRYGGGGYYGGGGTSAGAYGGGGGGGTYVSTGGGAYGNGGGVSYASAGAGGGYGYSGGGKGYGGSAYGGGGGGYGHKGKL
jgi:hypothetical protein